jgi:hypothetical protein
MHQFVKNWTWYFGAAKKSELPLMMPVDARLMRRHAPRSRYQTESVLCGPGHIKV